MRRVHVDEHQPRAVLREHVDAVELREREAERMVVAGVRQRRHAGPALAEQARVEGGGLGREREGVLRRDRLRPGIVATAAERRRARRGDAETVGGGHRGRLRRARGERALDRAPHERMQRAAVAKAHFGLLRMDVDVDATRIDRDPQRIGRLAVVVQHVAVGLAQRVREHPVADEAAVHEQHLRSAPFRRVRRPDRVARDRDARGLGVDGRRAADEGLAQQRLDAGRARPCGSSRWTTRPLCVQREPDLRMRERDARERLVAVRPLGLVGPQELAARGRVEVELLDRDRGARRERRRRDRRDRSAVDLDAPRVRPPRRARGEREPRHRRDRRQRLAAEAQRRDRLEVGGRADLRRRMPRDRERQVLAVDAPAVVHDADALDAAAGEVHVDARRARVEAVLDQLLQRRRRPLDDLARRDLVDEQVRQRTDRAHQCARPRAQRA
ncbi:MAG: hypothetical protein IPF73_16180 [Betaproteobacteria bacterium]|nr:hypothetical protein [Betaproteobacteria bacterium]